MDEKKEERKKESIDEILSDLNGLLNKMPAILEGIKLPEIKPLDLSEALKLDIPAAAPEPAPGPVPGPAPAWVPEPVSFTQKEDAFDKTVKLDESQLPGPAISGEKEKLGLQSLGEYMFSELSSASGGPRPPGGPGSDENAPGAQAPSFSVEPAGLDSAPELPEIKPAVNEPGPELRARPEPAAAEMHDIPGIYTPASQVNMDEVPVMEPENMDEEKKDKDLDGTRDFGVPDIDAMIRLSMEEALPGKGPAAQDGTPVEQAGPAPDAGSPEENAPQPGPVPAPEAKPDIETLMIEPAAAPEARPEPDIETLMIEPASGIADEKGVEAEIKGEVPADTETPAPQADALENTLSELKLEDKTPEPGLVLEEPSMAPAAAPAAPDEEKTMVVPPPSSASPDALENALPAQPGPEPAQQNASPQEFTLDIKEPSSAEPVPGLELSGSAFGSIPAAAAGAGDEDKTLVMPPPASGGDEDKTVIYEAGATSPGTTSRRSEDLGSLSSKQVPEGIPPERVRAVAFLYAREDAALCANMLAELDAVCLKSPSKPMFVQRAFVQICEPGTNGNVILQKVTDAKALGVVLLGEVPQDNVYEIENAVTAGGSFFRHLNREAFSHSAVLDLVTELILK